MQMLVWRCQRAIDSGTRRSRSSSVDRCGAVYIAPIRRRLPSGSRRYRSEVGMAGSNSKAARIADRQRV
jgi:hypothetical protein